MLNQQSVTIELRSLQLQIGLPMQLAPGAHQLEFLPLKFLWLRAVAVEVSTREAEAVVVQSPTTLHCQYPEPKASP
jgi:hypothetical protein